MKFLLAKEGIVSPVEADLMLVSDFKFFYDELVSYLKEKKKIRK